MASEIRPSVVIKEESIAGPVGGTATGRMAYVVISTRGKANTVLNISSEQDLVNLIGKPDSDQTSKDFHICKAFLGYGNDLIVVRAIDPDTAELARVGMDFSGTSIGIALTDTSDTKYFESVDSFSFSTILANHAGLDVAFYAKEASSTIGNNIKIAIGKPTQALWQNETITIDGSTKFADLFEFGPSAAKQEVAVVVSVDDVVTEKHIVSFVTTNRNDNNENNYIQDWFDKKSDYVWAFANGSIDYAEVETVQNFSLSDGTSGTTPTDGDIETAYAVLANKNEVTFDYITEGTHYNNRTYITTLCETRKDCIGFYGPKAADILNISNKDTIVSNIVADRIALTTSSWTCYFGNWARVYDKYRDKNIWIPITGHIIGNKVRLNTNRELWTPAAGTVNGVLSGVDAIAFNPNDTQQNTLYKNGVNHIVSISGRGIVCDGQKTMTNLNIGVSRLNTRDLFRFVETNVGSAARDYLHDYNDDITRARFVAAVTPLLEDIQRRRGLTRFEVICDSTNNTQAIIDNYGFRASVKITGNKPIENLTVTFFDVPGGVDFNEVPTV